MLPLISNQANFFSKTLSGIYIHIPFCRQACHYCNFHFSTSLRKKQPLLQALHKEIELSAGNAPLIETIYIGGGTPSILDAAETYALLQKVFLFFKVDANAEVTLEANPDDITPEKLQAWKASGINRLSIGIQSFFEEDLRWMNRAHNAMQAAENLQLAQIYFDNITIDLIYGVPGLTDERWLQNVQKAVRLGVPHLSCYALTVEPRTPLDKLIRTRKKENTDQDQQARQFLLLMDWLQNEGYVHYEISNFAKPGYRSRHNTSYWQGKNYFGFGPGAHSFNGSERQWNVANNQQYIDSLSQGIVPLEKETLTPVQKQNEYIMISLRTIEGIDLKKLSPMAVEQVLKTAQKFLSQKLLVQSNDRLQLTRQGKLFADGIASSLFID